MKLGSLFDGIGGFCLAAERHGITPMWASEIEQSCIDITKRHFPYMVHYGDVTQINGAEVEPVDIITAGSPCQDLSVAGKRAGLAGARSGLFGEFIRIIEEMRLATNDRYPTWAVWENVPGAYSSSDGLDFHAVLQSFANCEIPMPSTGRWANAGMVRGGQSDVAWRTLDAQFWGVPQRRRRIFLVADFGGKRSGEVLFKPESLRGNFTKSREQRQGIASDVVTGTQAANDNEAGQQAGRTRPVANDNVMIFEPRSQDGVPRIHDSVVPTLNTAQGGQRQPCIILNDQGGSIMSVSHDVVGTIRAEMHGNIPSVFIARTDQTGSNGLGICEDIAYTLDGTTGQAVLASGKNAVGVLMANAGTKMWQGNQEAFSGDYSIIQNQSVRRLTPLECERLQGFPDYWTAISHDGKPISDTKRYQALGNSVAIPCVEYVMAGIAEANDNEKGG